MNIDPSTIATSLALDALLCCGISAALTRVLYASSDALWNWAGAMLSFAVVLILGHAREGAVDVNLILDGLLPTSFSVLGAFCIYTASMSLNGRRRLRWSSTIGGLFFAVLCMSLFGPHMRDLNVVIGATGCTFFLVASAYCFAIESRWRSSFSGWFVILSLLALSGCSAMIGVVSLQGVAIYSPKVAPFLVAFEAAFLAGSFSFILAAAELARAQALELAMRDGLTGLLTKRAFFEAISPTISKAQREKTPCALLMLDIDFFKKINDAHGHLAGDSALIHVSEVIRCALRSSDVCARFGGEEFCALLPETDQEGAQQVAERILESLRQSPARFKDLGTGAELSIPCTISIGARCGFILPTDTASGILAKADEALYHSKRNGRDQLTIYDGKK